MCVRVCLDVCVYVIVCVCCGVVDEPLVVCASLHAHVCVLVVYACLRAHVCVLVVYACLLAHVCVLVQCCKCHWFGLCLVYDLYVFVCRSECAVYVYYRVYI